MEHIPVVTMETKPITMATGAASIMATNMGIITTDNKPITSTTTRALDYWVYMVVEAVEVVRNAWLLR